MEQNFLIRLLQALSKRLERIAYLRALGQAPNQVVVREPGHRFLGAPRPIRPYAEEHWQFAWLADSAYGKTIAGKASKAEHARQTEDPESVLMRAGWRQWPNDKFLSDALRKRFEHYHLRVEVWEKQSPPQVAVTFGGTVFNNKMDWLANLRWFTPDHVDEYTLTQIQFADAFAAEYVRLHRPDTSCRPCIYSTGHSLGGGLAQQFAYAQPDTTDVPRVTKVYAFDPSPVTGFFSVRKRLRDINRASLKIDRIYERGEILAIARSLTSLFWTPSASAPEIRGIRYNLFYTCNPVAGHSMKMLARNLEAAARGDAIERSRA